MWHEQWGMFSSMCALSLFTGYNPCGMNNGGCSHLCFSLSLQSIIRVAGTMGDVLIYVCCLLKNPFTPVVALQHLTTVVSSQSHTQPPLLCQVNIMFKIPSQKKTRHAGRQTDRQTEMCSSMLLY